MKYSIIIPVYNAMDTIRRCADSLLNQRYADAEILLIDDGSSDESGSICQTYAERNHNVRYYKKLNGGVSSARNYGLDHAIGKYLLFVDSDDYVTPDFFAAIDAALSEYDYDLIQFSNYFSGCEVQSERIREPFQALTREALFSKLIETLYRKKSNGPVAKVYKNSLVREHSIRFPEEIEVGEDRAFYIHYSFYMNSFCISNRPVYVVNMENENSLSRKIRNDLDEQTEQQNRFLRSAMDQSGIPDSERREYQKAMNYDRLRMVYSKAKNLHKAKVPLLRRLRLEHAYCRDLNRTRPAYPDSRYCRLTSLPVRWNLAAVIDAIAWKLTQKG